MRYDRDPVSANYTTVAPTQCMRAQAGKTASAIRRKEGLIIQVEQHHLGAQVRNNISTTYHVSFHSNHLFYRIRENLIIG